MFKYIKVLGSILIGLVLSTSAFATSRGNLQGYVERGGNNVTTGFLRSSTLVQRSWPNATVTVYSPTGTTNIATIYNADDSSKGNPFTADSTGKWIFYADDGDYDVQFTDCSPSCGLVSPWTLTALRIGLPINTTILNATIGTGAPYAEPGAANTGLQATALTIVSGSQATPVTTSIPDIVYRRYESVDPNLDPHMPISYSMTMTKGRGFMYFIHNFVRNQSNQFTDAVVGTFSHFGPTSSVVPSGLVCSEQQSVPGGPPAGTYFYRVAPILSVNSAEAASSNPVTVVTSGVGVVRCTWNAFDGAASYRLYRSTTDSLNQFYAVAGAVTTFDDDGTNVTNAGQGINSGIRALWLQSTKNIYATRAIGIEMEVHNQTDFDASPVGSGPDSTIGIALYGNGTKKNSVGLMISNGATAGHFFKGIAMEGVDNYCIDYQNIGLGNVAALGMRTMNNQWAIGARNAANSADINLIKVNSSNIGELGVMMTFTAITQANLGTPADGTLTYCSTCTSPSNPCTGGGTGALAFRQNGTWKCF